MTLNRLPASSVLSGSLVQRGTGDFSSGKEMTTSGNTLSKQIDSEEGGGEIKFYNILFYKGTAESIKEYLKNMTLHSAEGIN